MARWSRRPLRKAKDDPVFWRQEARRAAFNRDVGAPKKQAEIFKGYQ
jgi:hypothetical protein